MVVAAPIASSAAFPANGYLRRETPASDLEEDTCRSFGHMILGGNV
jgi:hypothetical protein